MSVQETPESASGAQLALFGAAVFSARPERPALPKTSSQPPVAAPDADSLELTFDRPRSSVEQIVSGIRAHMAKKSRARDRTAEDEAPAPRVFLIRRKLTAAAQAALMAELATMLDGTIRGRVVEARSSLDRVTARLEPKSLTVDLTTRAAQERWLSAVLQFARAHDLVESE